MITLNQTKCYGCHACAESCPEKCITMKPNQEGFLYPVINNEDCINCGLCSKVCPIDKENEKEYLPTAFAARNPYEEDRLRSSSGGAFLPLAESIINDNGVVFGVQFSDDFGAEHSFAQTKQELYKFCGSKYIQSNLKNSFSKAKGFLEDGRTVLFTGTACQIAGLKNYLQKDYDNLFTLDVICHGVASPELWKKYIQSFKKGVPSEASFRNKENGWKNFSIKLKFNSFDYICKNGADRFYALFISNLILRESCYNCAFKMKNISSDLTIADFWGINGVIPELDDDKGISLIFSNTEKGNKLLQQTSDNLEKWEVPFEAGIKHNTSAHKTPERSSRRDKYLNAMSKGKSFNYIFNNCYHRSKPEYAIHCLKKLLGKEE